MDWITDRQPTRADADINAQILVRHDGLDEGEKLQHWNSIPPKVHWRHTSFWRPPAEPAPEHPAAEPAPDPGLSGWITSRRPTEADGDERGDVRVRDNPDRGIGVYVHWSHISLGAPWKHSELWTPPSEPEPTAPEKPAVAVGQKWRRRDGEIVTIAKNDGSHQWTFMASDGNYYEPNGYFYSASQIDKRDLIELISEAPEPTPEPATEPRPIKQLLRTRNPDGSHTLDAIDDGGVAWVLYPGTDRWEELIHLPARRVPAQQLQS
jgi:hypothetical protein